jgi:hypothetical protein
MYGTYNSEILRTTNNLSVYNPFMYGHVTDSQFGEWNREVRAIVNVASD